MPTGYVYDERCLTHDNGSTVLDERARGWLDVPHAESARRVARTHAALQASGVAENLERIPAREATEQELRLVHAPSYIERIRSMCDSAGPVSVGPEARAGPGSWDPALISAGGTLAAVDWVLGGQGRNAYVLLRPPGHHASLETAMGFCLFNNVAIATRYCQREYGIGRVAIVDWDVHHGNGTQDTFYDDRSVLFISVHQDGLYPNDTGSPDELGSGEGAGTVLNVPLPAGTGDDGYRRAFERIVTPTLRSFEPDLIFISAGQDAAASDPLGRMSVTTEGFRAMTGAIQAVAEEACGGRIVAVQEGGYSPDHMPYCVVAIVEQLAGLKPQFETDPLEIDVPSSIRRWEADAVEAVATEWEDRVVALGNAR